MKNEQVNFSADHGDFTAEFRLRQLDELVERLPELAPVGDEILRAAEMLVEAFRRDAALFVAGNGGSCSDAGHIVGELQKGFLNRRPLSDEAKRSLSVIDPERGGELAENLQQGLRAISLTAHTALMTAVSNDIGGDYIMAQSLYALGRPGDVLLAVSTSGNAENVLLACATARLRKMAVIALTGRTGGRLRPVADVCIRAPATETYRVQEYHLPIYHALCIMVEQALFG